MNNDSYENMTHLPSDAEAYAAADEQFELDEDYERSLRQAPRTKHTYPPITDEDIRLGEQDIREAQQKYAAHTARLLAEPLPDYEYEEPTK